MRAARSGRARRVWLGVCYVSEDSEIPGNNLQIGGKECWQWLEQLRGSLGVKGLDKHGAASPRERQDQEDEAASRRQGINQKSV